jgi:hypothetical protein
MLVIATSFHCQQSYQQQKGNGRIEDCINLCEYVYIEWQLYIKFYFGKKNDCNKYDDGEKNDEDAGFLVIFLNACW